MEITTRTIVSTCVAATLAATVAVPAANARRAPTATERAALAQAGKVPRRCLRIHVATVRAGWASVSFHGGHACARYASNGVAVWRRRDDVWRFR
jgi:hypothetical protein